MSETVELAEKRAFRLDVAWIFAMSLGTLAAIQFGFVADTYGQISTSTPTAALLFLFIGIIGTPLAILFSLPCWNIISPIQDRATIWEGELIIYLVTAILLTVSSAYFFDISGGAAIKTQILMAAAFAPIRCLSAQYNWYAETTKMRQDLLRTVPGVTISLNE